MSPAPVINLSNQFLNHNEINLLGKGLKFIPKPNSADRAYVDEALADFNRRIKLTAFFSDYQIESKDKNHSEKNLSGLPLTNV